MGAQTSCRNRAFLIQRYSGGKSLPPLTLGHVAQLGRWEGQCLFGLYFAYLPVSHSLKDWIFVSLLVLLSDCLSVCTVCRFQQPANSTQPSQALECTGCAFIWLLSGAFSQHMDLFSWEKPHKRVLKEILRTIRNVPMSGEGKQVEHVSGHEAMGSGVW